MLGEAIVLYRQTDGTVVAREDARPHRGRPPSTGRIKGDHVECGYPGLTLEGKGICTRVPGAEKIPHMARAGLSDCRTLWPAVNLDGPCGSGGAKQDLCGRKLGQPHRGLNWGDAMPLDCNDLDMTDNLLDPSHVAWVHQSSIGSAAAEEAPLQTTIGDNCVTVWRWMLNIEPAPFEAPYLTFKATCDRKQHSKVHYPCQAIIKAVFTPAGTGREDRGRASGRGAMTTGATAFWPAARAAGTDLSKYAHPLPGPNGPVLATDVALIGPPYATRLFIIISGTHGVNGAFGSACQTAWLDQMPVLPAGVAILMIHLIKPWGIASGRRLNEDNVDLNRNFINWTTTPPSIQNYDQFHAALISECAQPAPHWPRPAQTWAKPNSYRPSRPGSVPIPMEAGEVVSMIGSSDSGKSILLQCINFLEQPNGGKVIIDGEPVRMKALSNVRSAPADQSQIERIRARAGMVFEGFNLWPHMTVPENLIEAPMQVLAQDAACVNHRGALSGRSPRDHAMFQKP
jgi:ABC-type multidrug transport system fused ATPase/permease subunit